MDDVCVSFSEANANSSSVPSITAHLLLMFPLSLTNPEEEEENFLKMCSGRAQMQKRKKNPKKKQREEGRISTPEIKLTSGNSKFLPNGSIGNHWAGCSSSYRPVGGNRTVREHYADLVIVTMVTRSAQFQSWSAEVKKLKKTKKG